MEIEEVSCEKYVRIVDADIVYNYPEFNVLNAYKVDQVKFFLFREKGYRFALCAGQKQKCMYVPFSAPFALIVPLKKRWRLVELERAIVSLEVFAIQAGIKSISFLLPPTIYGETLISSLQNVLLRRGFLVQFQDLNYYFDLHSIRSIGYDYFLHTNGKKNLAIAQKKGLIFKRCISIDEEEMAYTIIASNRKYKGYPLRMTLAQLKETFQMVTHDCFLVFFNHCCIASAIIYHVTSNIVQVIYWGDLPGYTELKPINFLASQLICYYSQRDFQYIDIGPSSEKGVPNYGLCNFKKSIGCNVGAKFMLSKKLEISQ